MVVLPAELVFAGNPIGSRFVIGAVVNGVQNEIKIFSAPLASLDGDKTPWKMIADNSDEVTDMAVHGDLLYLLTHKGASHFKVLKLSLAPKWKVSVGS